MTVPVLVLLGLVALAGCGQGDVERRPYVQHNLALLKSVPAMGDAHLVRTESWPQRTGDGEGWIRSYRTTRVYNLAKGTTSADALRFYRDELTRRGWRVVTSGVDHLNFGRGDAYLHVLSGRGRVYVGADYNCADCLATP